MRKDPLYLQVMDGLKKQILTETIDYNAVFTTEKRIAEEFHVSRITAARALNELDREHILIRRCGSGSYVSGEAKQIIRAYFDDKERKESEKAGLIGLVLPYEPDLNLVGECVKGINEILNPRNRYLSIHCSERSVIREAEILRELAEIDLDGVICLPCSSFENVEIFSYYGMIGKPILFIDLYSESMPISAVVSDNRTGSRALCDQFFERGHTRIGYFAHGSISNLSSLKDRYLGYVDSLMAHNRPVNLDYIETNIKERVKYENSLDSREVKYNKELFGSRREYEYKMYELYLEERLRRLLNLGVTAILCENDWIAMEVLSICEEIGVKIPSQLELAGFDNVSELMGIRSGRYILTAEQDYREIGRLAGKLILDKAVFGQSAAPEIHYVPVRPVIRNAEERQITENA